MLAVQTLRVFLPPTRVAAFISALDLPGTTPYHASLYGEVDAGEVERERRRRGRLVLPVRPAYASLSTASWLRTSAGEPVLGGRAVASPAAGSTTWK